MTWAADTYVTAANPAPGRNIPDDNPYGHGTPNGTRSDGGIGINVYIAGGTGLSGAVPVQLVGASSGGTGDFVTIAGPLDGGAVRVTGSVLVLNPSSGGGVSGSVQISGTASVNVMNWPATQSVALSGPLQVSGSVGVVGTASVRVESVGAALPVTGTVHVDNQVELPATQSVFVTNQLQSGPVQISGVSPTSGALPVSMSFPTVQQVTGTVNVSGLQVSGSFSIPREAYPNSLENVEATRQRVRYDLSSVLVNYIGYAPVGTADEDAAWTIKRMSFESGSGDLTAIEWSASGTAVWVSRSLEVYA